MNTQEYFSIPEVAQLMGVSRIYIYALVKKGSIQAIRIGRNYAIPKKNIDVLLRSALSDKEKDSISKGVKKTIREYGDVLKKLGNE